MAQDCLPFKIVQMLYCLHGKKKNSWVPHKTALHCIDPFCDFLVCGLLFVFGWRRWGWVRGVEGVFVGKTFGGRKRYDFLLSASVGSGNLTAVSLRRMQ